MAKISVKMKVLRGPRTSEVGVVAQIGFGRSRRWTLRFADNSIANFEVSRKVAPANSYYNSFRTTVIFTVAGTPLTEQRCAGPPDDDDTEANSEEQSEKENNASTETSEDDGAENQAPLSYRWSGLPYLTEMIICGVSYLFA